MYLVIIASLISTVDTFMQNYLSITQNMHIIVISANNYMVKR